MEPVKRPLPKSINSGKETHLQPTWIDREENVFCERESRLEECRGCRGTWQSRGRSQGTQRKRDEGAKHFPDLVSTSRPCWTLQEMPTTGKTVSGLLLNRCAPCRAETIALFALFRAYKRPRLGSHRFLLYGDKTRAFVNLCNALERK